ncbi:putative AIM2 family protein [Smittium culicis]|uniref:Putative AIM2 family protein n=2 Tax=Smittium culicis TaxID=133412 RepID=A0A1R1X9C7_9FUNG|nr:putative AIM2 family protein [Smittium culicis]
MAQVHLPYPVNDKSIVVKYDEPTKYELIPTEPVKADYTPIGEKIDIEEGVNCYITGSKDSKAGIIYFYDVGGYSDNIFQQADILGKRGYRVLIPNFWINEPSVIELLDDEVISKTSELKTYYPRTKKYIDAAKNHLVQVEKIENIFVAGECLGGKVAANAAEFDNFYIGCATLHPSSVNNDDLARLDVPTIVVGGFDDPDYTDGINSFKNKGLGDYSYYKVFPEVYHGFLASGANYSNPIISNVANSVLSIVATYFDQVLEARKVNPEIFKRSGDRKEFKRTNTVLGHFGKVGQKGGVV